MIGHGKTFRRGGEGKSSSPHKVVETSIDGDAFWPIEAYSVGPMSQPYLESERIPEPENSMSVAEQRELKEPHISCSVCRHEERAVIGGLNDRPNGWLCVASIPLFVVPYGHTC